MTTEPNDSNGAGPLRPRRSPSVPLAALVGDPTLSSDVGDGAVRITGITQNSREVVAGDLYVARAGARSHGADFAPSARAAGAVAALTDTAGAQRCRDAGLVTVIVDDPAAVAGPIAHELYGRPADGLTLIGITGTNGKTTTSYFVDAALRALGHRPGVIGTIATKIGGATEAESVLRPAARTTPESTELAVTLATMREAGCVAVVMEVSSHALSLGRVDDLRFAVGGFLNLAEDHLDLHHDMQSYFLAKAALFSLDRAAAGVVDIDTAWGERLVGMAAAAGLPVVTMSTAGTAADIGIADIRVDVTGATHATLSLPGERRVPIEVGMPGLHNLTDAVMAVALVDQVSGGDPAAAATAAAAMAAARVPGRMERFDLPVGARAFVDFAHTPEAITSALSALVRRPGGRVIAVAGCGGDRDAGKRGPMGAALAAGADVVVITDDNPRSEDPAAIRAAALAGVRGAGFGGELVEIGDRSDAIAFALGAAGADDVVIVLGKGHEQGQDVAGVLHPFDDREQIRRWMARP